MGQSAFPFAINSSTASSTERSVPVNPALPWASAATSASVTPTAGGLVLTGDTKGNFLAFDAKDGKVLLEKNLGDPIGGGSITYEIGGVAYLTVAGGMKNTVAPQTDSGPAWVAILALPQ